MTLHRPRFPPPPDRRRGDDVAVSDVVGSILMVGITVVMATGLGLLILGFNGPRAETRANLEVTLDPGAFGWGSGDESIRISHLGGDTILTRDARVTYVLNGVTTSISDTNLGSAFSDGKFMVGEVWIRPQALQASDSVAVNFVSVNTLVAATTVVPSTLGSGPNCVLDSAPPSVDPTIGWTQSQPDVVTTTTGAIDVTVGLKDTCRGVATSPLPELWYRIYDTVTGLPAAYTMSTLPVTYQGSNVFKGTIPSGLDYGHSGGKRLQYQFQHVTDGINEGTVDAPDDTIGVITVLTYVNCASGSLFATAAGSIANCVKAQDTVTSTTADFVEGATVQTSAATILVGSTASNGGSTLLAGTSTGTCASPFEACAKISDDNRVMMDATADIITVTGFTAPAGATGISSAIVGVEGRRHDGTSPTVHLTWTGSGGIAADALLASNAATQMTLGASDCTTCERAVTGVTLANLNTLVVRVDGTSSSLLVTRRADIDQLYVKITYTYNTYSFGTGILADLSANSADGSGNVRTFEAKASVTAAGTADTVDAYVCQTFSPVNTPAGACTGWGSAKFSFTPACCGSAAALTSGTLTNAEWNGGNPRFRFLDATALGTVQTTFKLDYIRVNLS